jgi:hypothetical protein
MTKGLLVGIALMAIGLSSAWGIHHKKRIKDTKGTKKYFVPFVFFCDFCGETPLVPSGLSSSSGRRYVFPVVDVHRNVMIRVDAAEQLIEPRIICL